jgi:DNA repair protein RadD
MPGMKLLIVDECHNTRRQTVEFIKNNPGIYVVGLTATPFTKGLGKIYSSVVSAISTGELVERGMLVPLRVFIAKEIDMAGAKKVAGEWSSAEAEERGIKITGDLAQKFSDAGYNFVSLSYKDDDEFKAEAIREFAKPDSSILGLIATDILTKGFDVPDVMIGVSARPFSKSLASHIQQMGRVMRKHPSKEFALWLDHSGNYLRFAEDWEDIYANGVSELDETKERARKEPTEKEKEAAKCPRCNAFWPGRADACACCGFVRPQRSTVTERPGELAEYSPDGKKLPGREERQAFFSQLCGIAMDRGYKRGWAFHKYVERYGVQPKGLSDTPMEPSAKVQRWVRSRQIAWANSRKNVERQEAVAA